MCQKHSTVMFLDFRIDPCMKDKMAMLFALSIPTLACCCGHGKYPETIVVNSSYGPHELNTGTKIPRKKRFYCKDKDGIYYIPEISQRNIKVDSSQKEEPS